MSEWVTCPICGEPDMRQDAAIINCVNLVCASNGGTNWGKDKATPPTSTTPSALSREQVERECKWLVEEHCDSAAKKWLATDATQRLTIEQRDEQIEKLTAYIIANVTGEPSRSEGAVDTAIRVLAQQAQRIEELETRRNNFHVDAPMWRGIDPGAACLECGGSGTKTYANTSTYHYSAGGQAMTLSVCDKCWGSGDKFKLWPSWKHQAQEIERVQTSYDADMKHWTAQLAAMTAERDEVIQRRRETVAVCEQLQTELAASQARVRELEQEKANAEPDTRLFITVTDHERQLATLQATLAEREREVNELHGSIRTAAKGIVDLTCERNAWKAQFEDMDRLYDTARQDAARLREAALWAMKKVKRLSTRAVDYKRADDFIQHEEALKGA